MTSVTLPGQVTMPMLGLGTWQLTGKSGYTAMRAALDLGYRHLDTATMYRNESEVGRAVRDSGIDRAEVFVTTKLLASDAGKEAGALDASLKALDLGYIDLWLVHWPPSARSLVPTWRALIEARDGGRVRAIGVSNYSTAQLDELIGATGVAPAVNQIPWSVAEHDPERLAEHRDRDVLLEGYSPLKHANLREPVLVAIADRHGLTPAQVILRWHLDHGIAVIPKSGNPARLAENLKVLDARLGADEIAEIDGLSRTTSRCPGSV